MKSYIVAGGAGFIGSHICERLLSQDSRVYCIDNLITGNEKNIARLLEDENFTFINQDITHGEIAANGQIDGIFHLASPASPNAKSSKSYIAHPVETLLVNSLGTKNLLDCALKNKSSIVFASSSEVYGDPTVSPQKEDYFGNVNPNGIRSVYDEGKRFGESICMTYHRKYGVDARIVRIFNTYGAQMQKDDGRVVSNFINQALEGKDITIYGDGSQTRSFCYVDDLVDGLILTMEEASARGRVINLGNDDEHKINEIAEIIRKLTGSESKIVNEDLPKDDPHQRRPDLSLAKELLGYEPKITLDEGLKKTIEYFKSI